MFNLYYNVINGGDGSAIVKFHYNKEQAEKIDEEQPQGWGESSVGCITLRIIDGVIYRETYEYLEKKKEYQKVLIPLEITGRD